jgi:hypothetical protein
MRISGKLILAMSNLRSNLANSVSLLLQTSSILLFAALMTGCAQTGPLPTEKSAASPTVLPPTGTALPSPTSTSTVPTAVFPTLTPSPTLISATNLCSPLENETIEALSSPDLLKNTYVEPRLGYDDGHPAIDLSFWSAPGGKAMLGLPVQSVLDGQVAAVLPNRMPYGNALILETPLDRLPTDWVKQLKLPVPNAKLQPSYSLSCSAYQYTPQTSHLSIYILYAHLNKPASLEVHDKIACGQRVGEVGTTGNSVNPHLHLEMRVGPTDGITFASMAHYDTASTQEERQAYCLWRISGAFRPFNPLDLFQLSLLDH